MLRLRRNTGYNAACSTLSTQRVGEKEEGFELLDDALVALLTPAPVVEWFERFVPCRTAKGSLIVIINHKVPFLILLILG
jgi:hypothetical protein